MRKGFDIGFKDVDVKQGIVSGYFANFNSVDSDGDIVEPGAFKKSIQERGPEGKKLIKWLLDHDTTKVIGSLQVLKEDSVGLYYEGKVGRHSAGKDFLAMVEDDLINQHSFGYKVIKESYDNLVKANRLKELMIYEGSSVQFLGSNENTPILGLKSYDDILEYMGRVERFIKTSTATDETLIKLDTQLKSLQTVLEPLINTPKEVEKPIDAEMLKSIFSKTLLKINGN